MDSSNRFGFRRGQRKGLFFSIVSLLFLSGTAWAWSPVTGSYTAGASNTFALSCANELTGWLDNELTYYYDPGSNNWLHTSGTPAIVDGSVTLNSDGTYTASGNAAPPTSGTYVRTP